MAVTAPLAEQRQHAAQPSQAASAVSDWLAWLKPMMSGCTWMAIVDQSDSAGTCRQVYRYPETVKTPAAAMLVAARALAARRVLAVNLGMHEPDATTLLAVPLVGPVDTQSSQATAGPSPRLQRVLLLLANYDEQGQQATHVKIARWASIWLQAPENPPESEDLVLSTISRNQSMATAVAKSGGPSTTESDTPAIERSATFRDQGSLAEAVVSAANETGTARAIGQAIVDTLKRLYKCQRVSIAVRSRGETRLRLLAISDQTSVDVRRALPGQILAAMQERLSNGVAGNAMDVLYQEQGNLAALVSIHHYDSSSPGAPASAQPAKTRSDTAVVILLERVTRQSDLTAFTDAQQQSIDTVLTPVCALLVHRIQAEASWMVRLRQTSRRWLQHEHYQQLTRQQMLTAALGVLVPVVLLIPVSQQVTARAVIEAENMQVLMAPQDGYLATAHVRAGDTVSKGQLMATLDARDLQLSIDKWQSEATKNKHALDIALAGRDRVELSRVRADRARIDAELALAESQLARARLTAPFEGVVLSGDLDQRLGASVVQGDTLFTIGASNEYRLMLDVDEHDVQLVAAAQNVRVRMAAIPDQTWHASIDAVLPVAVAGESGNVFRVPATLEEDGMLLRPGMEGVAKLQVGKRSLAYVYSRNILRKIALMLWRMGLIS